MLCARREKEERLPDHIWIEPRPARMTTALDLACDDVKTVAEGEECAGERFQTAFQPLIAV